MDDAEFHAPSVADVDDTRVFIACALRLFGCTDLVDLGLGDHRCGGRVAGRGCA